RGRAVRPGHAVAAARQDRLQDARRPQRQGRRARVEGRLQRGRRGPLAAAARARSPEGRDEAGVRLRREPHEGHARRRRVRRSGPPAGHGPPAQAGLQGRGGPRRGKDPGDGQLHDRAPLLPHREPSDGSGVHRRRDRGDRRREERQARNGQGHGEAPERGRPGRPVAGLRLLRHADHADLPAPRSGGVRLHEADARGDEPDGEGSRRDQGDRRLVRAGRREARGRDQIAPQQRYGSDVIVDLLRAFGIDYVALNPGASYRGLHDSLVNYGGNKPEMILCTHEEIAVSIAHGYAKVTGKPMAAIVHDVVGLLHAAMTIYYAFIDRVPLILIGATGPLDRTKRRPYIDWIHSALVQGNAVRDYVKWDDQPATVADFPASFARAFRIATTEPAGPVYLCYDAGLQEDALAAPVSVDAVLRGALPSPVQADPRALERAAAL